MGIRWSCDEKRKNKKRRADLRKSFNKKKNKIKKPKPKELKNQFFFVFGEKEREEATQISSKSISNRQKKVIETIKNTTKDKKNKIKIYKSHLQGAILTWKRGLKTNSCLPRLKELSP